MQSPIFRVGLAIHIGGTSIGASVQSGRIVVMALLFLVAHHGFNLTRSVHSLCQNGRSAPTTGRAMALARETQTTRTDFAPC